MNKYQYYHSDLVCDNPDCKRKFIGRRNQKYCSDFCRSAIRRKGVIKRNRYLVIEQIKQEEEWTPICSHFGCNKQLSHTESLYSNKCFLHQNLKRIDINKIISK